MSKKNQSEVIHDLQINPDFIILNNPMATPKFVRQVGKKGKEQQITEIYTPKIFFEIVSRLTPQHLENAVGKYVQINFNVGDFLRELGLKSSKNYYNHIIDCVDEMQRINIKYEDDETLGSYSVIPDYSYGKSKGDMVLDLNVKLVKKILEVKHDENFSFLKKYLFKLQNAQAVKLFPFFVSWKNKGMVELTVDNFKKKFGYDTEGYKFFTNLKNKVLDPAMKEINEKTELFISYTLLGTSLESQRPRVTGLRFFISEKKAAKQLLSPTTDLEPVKPTNKPVDVYENDIIRIFRIFEHGADEVEIKGFVKNMEGLGDILAVLEACLYAELEQERLQKTGKSILSFRGYLISGLQKGMGRGLWAQKKAQNQQKQALDDMKKLLALKAEQLENWLAQAKKIRENYQAVVNDIIKKTATDEEKENVAAILRGQSSIYANKTVSDFRNKMYWVTFITTFIKTYSDRFEPATVQFSAQYEEAMQHVLTLDKSKYNKLVY
jgi:Initiator Replication protein